MAGKLEYIEEKPPLERAKKLKAAVLAQMTQQDPPEMIATPHRQLDQLQHIALETPEDESSFDVEDTAASYVKASQRRSLQLFDWSSSESPYLYGDNRIYYGDNTAAPNNQQMVLGAQVSWAASVNDYVDTVY